MIERAIPGTIVIVLACLAVVSCGGGTGGSSSTAGGGTGSGTVDTGTPTVEVSLVDDNGDAVTTIRGNDTATARALVKDSAGDAVSSIVVSFSTTNVGQITPTTALTDSQGTAEATVSAGTLSGAGTLSATATVNGTDVTSNALGFQTDAESTGGSTGAEGVQLGICASGSSVTDCANETAGTFDKGTIDLSSTQISAGGTASLTLVVLDGNFDPVSGAQVSFTSDCAARTDQNSGEPLAALTNSASSNGNGVVTATYQANGCEGDDKITAEEAGSGETASGTLNVLSPIIGSIRFDSASKQNIQIKGTGDSTATLTFQVLDVQGDPVEDEEVQFELTTDVGGLSLASSSGLTDADGLAKAIVNAGFIATTVRVRAGLRVDTDSPPDGIKDKTIETLSERLSVNTGVAYQNAMSLSAETLNIEGENFDGITTTLTVRLADRFNNPVPDGTAVQFRTELGAIDSSCTTTGGQCGVTLTSQEPRRPLNGDYQMLSSDSCPAMFIYEEPVTISGSDGNTDYVADDVFRVETIADVALTKGTDYTVDDDGSGITCEGASVTCIDGADLKITYDRAWLDEEGDGDGSTHPVPDPGVATAPFKGISGVPCVASSRERDMDVSGYHGGLGQLYGGRSTVLAFAQGEESFVDSNANGQYDLGEPFVDLPEAFMDVNEDDVFGNPDASGAVRKAEDDSDPTADPHCYGPRSPLKDPDSPQDELCYQRGGDEEEFIDFDANGSYNEGNGIYNGTSCPKEVSDRTDSSLSCDNASDPCTSGDQYCTRELVSIRKELPILLSGSGAYMGLRDVATGEYISQVDLTVTTGRFTANTTVTANDGVTTYATGMEFTIGNGDMQVRPGIGESVDLTSGTGSVIVDVSDAFNGILPAGTSISFAAGSNGCAIQNTPGTDVASTDAFGFNQIFISLGPPDSPATGSAPITVSVSTPQSQEVSRSFACSF